MTLCKMKFREFEFPLNPAVIEVKYSKNISKTPLFGSDSATEGVSRNAAVICGEGSFFGEGAFALAAELERLNKSEADGWLFLPDGGCFKAFFEELTVRSDAKKNEVFYTFKFVESCAHKKQELLLDFTTVRDGENLFDVAHRTRVPLERIMDLNSFKSPFDVSAGDKAVLR